MTQPARILTVCTGNVCRSPYLERRLQYELDRSWGRGAFEVRSAGTGAVEGAGVEPQAAELLRQAGGDPEGFAARSISPELLSDRQLVIVATREHRALVTRLYPKALARTHTLGDLALLAGLIGDDELPERADAHSYVAALAPLVAGKRGLQLPPSADMVDIVDPIGQPFEVFQRMSDQIERALPSVLRILGC